MTDNNSHTAISSSFPPSDWVETSLGDVGKTITGKTPSKDNPEDWGEIMDFITPTDLKSDSKYIENTARKLSENGIERFSKMIIPKNSLIVTCIGSDMGKVVINKNDCLTNQQINSLIVNQNYDVNFVYYKLKDSYSLLRSRADGGSTMPILNKSNFESLQFLFPPLPEQQAIASVLSAFDDKIELLREQNKILEEMGQVIFHEWFGKYGVDDELPEGWRVFELSEIVDIINGYAYKGSDLVEDSKTALVTLKSFDRNGGFQTRGFKPFIGNPKETQEVKIGDLVVAHTDLTQDAEVLGNPAFIFDDGGFKKMFITMDLVKVISKDENITNAFLYYLMKTKEFKGHCVGYANGTTVLHLSKKAIPEYQIALPNDFGVLSDVSLLLKETTDKIADINSQIQTLANTRDEILPKLMSGMLRVNDFSNN